MILKTLEHTPQTLPSKDDIFNVFTLPFDKVRVVIVGQDPYPTRGMAHGLAFSVLPHVKKLPRSLANIFKEYRDDLEFSEPRNGDLRSWHERGVLLLNQVLTVEEGLPLSHNHLGWQLLTFEVVKRLSEDRDKLVFILWGNEARRLKAQIDTDKHLVLESVHPSPLSAHAGFFGSKPFSKTCEFLGVSKESLWKL